MSDRDWYRREGDKLFIDIHLRPRAAADKVDGVRDGRLVIRVSAPPVDGKANRQLISFLAGRLGIAASRIRILRGERSHFKQVTVAACDQMLDIAGCLGSPAD